MSTWPDYMPSPVYDAIRISAPTGAVIRTDMDAGPAKQRKRFSAAPRPVSLVFEPLSSVQLSAFEDFLETDLSLGAIEFTMAHPITEEVRAFRFVANEEPWAMLPVGKDAYRLTVNLELMP